MEVLAGYPWTRRLEGGGGLIHGVFQTSGFISSELSMIDSGALGIAPNPHFWLQ